MATTPEGRVKTAIKKYLKSIPGCWYFMPIGGAFTVHGIPDIVGLVHGRFFAIECKAPGREATTTANQKNVMSAIEKVGGVVFVASSVEQVRSVFVQHGWDPNYVI